MRNAKRAKLLDLLRHFGGIASNIVLLWMSLHFRRIFGDADRTQIGKLDLSRVAANLRTMLLENRKLVSILLRWTGIEVPPICIASNQGQSTLLTTAPDQ